MFACSFVYAIVIIDNRSEGCVGITAHFCTVVYVLFDFISAVDIKTVAELHKSVNIKRRISCGDIEGEGVIVLNKIRFKYCCYAQSTTEIFNCFKRTGKNQTFLMV